MEACLSQGNGKERETTMKRFKSVFYRSTVLILVCIGFYASQAFCGEKIYRWKIQSAYPRGDVSMELLNDFAADAKKQSNGRLLVKVFADPELVPAEQLIDATSHGIIDMVHGLGAMWAGTIPIGEVEFGLPYTFRTKGKSFKDSASELRSFFFQSGFVDLLRKEYAKKDLYWLDMHSYGPNVILSTKPIKTLNDLSGLKITVEGAFNEFFSDLGAAPAIVSGTETYMGLKLGTVDAAQWDISAISALKWHEVAPYWIKGGQNDQSFGHILINHKRWDALPDDLKTVLRDCAKSYWDKMVDIYDSEMKKADNLVKEGKIKVCELDSECLKAHEAAAEKIWEKFASGGPVNAEAIHLIKKFNQHE